MNIILIAIWFVVANITGTNIKQDLREEKQLVKLFEQTDHAYHYYFAKVKR